MLNNFMAFRHRLSTSSSQESSKTKDAKKVMKKSVSFHGDSALDYLPWSKPNSFSVVYTLSAGLMVYAGLFEQPLFLLGYFIVVVIFLSPVTPEWLSLVPDGKGTSEMTLPSRRSGFITVAISDPPVEGSKPLNFKYSPSWLEYKTAGLIAPFLFRHGVTPNMVTTANILYRALFLYHIISHPNYMISNFTFMWSSQMLDCLDGLMARKYDMGSEFGAWLDATSDETYGTALVVALISFYSRYAWGLIIIFSLGVVLIPMGCKAYMDSLRLNNKNATFAEKVGPGGSRTLNFYEFCGAFSEEYMAFLLLLCCYLMNLAHVNNYWIDPADASFADRLQGNVTDVLQFLEPATPSFLISWVSHFASLVGL